MSDDELTVAEVMREYGLSKQGVYDWRDKYGIGKQRFGVWVFTRAELERANKQSQEYPAGRPRKGWFGKGK